jgi:1-acyl-sn-glycerol-3-phosphate acyltransferase
LNFRTITLPDWKYVVIQLNSGLNALLTVPVFAILYAITAAGLFVVIIISWFRGKKIVRFLMGMWSKLVFLLMGKKLTVSGKENIKKDEKYIVVANHASLFDIVAITSFYPQVSWFGHERLLKVPVFGKFLKLTEYVPFREPTVRNTRNMIRQLMERADNNSVALFPEGTRTLDGKINPFYRGFIYLFRTREISILPVTLNGFYNLKPKNRFYIDFGSKLSVVIHKPIPREELLNKSDEEIINRVKSVIESAYH